VQNELFCTSLTFVADVSVLHSSHHVHITKVMKVVLVCRLCSIIADALSAALTWYKMKDVYKDKKVLRKPEVSTTSVLIKDGELSRLSSGRFSICS
jgi:hypothetical protein